MHDLVQRDLASGASDGASIPRDAWKSPGGNPFANPPALVGEDEEADQAPSAGDGLDRWLTIPEAAARLGVSESSIRRYVSRDGLTVLLGRISERQLIEVEAGARRRAAGSRFGGKSA